MKDPRDPISVVIRGLQYYPSIYPNIFRVLEHIFLTNGNGYELDKRGNLYSKPYPLDRKGVCITKEGLNSLMHDMMEVRCLTVYPINSYDYEIENAAWIAGPGKGFYTRLYHYPALNEKWRLAARYLIYVLLDPTDEELKAHYGALDANPIPRHRTPIYAKEYLAKAMAVRKHIKEFCDKFSIKYSFEDKYAFEKRFIREVDPKNLILKF